MSATPEAPGHLPRGRHATEIAAEYGEWLRSWSPSRSTVTARRTLAANRLAAWGLEGFTVENVQVWLGTTDFTAWSRVTYFHHLRDFCAWAVRAGYLEVDPMPEVRRPRRPKPLPRPLSDAEVDRALAGTSGQIRDWIVLAMLSGLRAHEIAKLRGEDVTETHIFVDGKGGVRAAIPTHPELWVMADRYPERGYWFVGRRGNEHVNPNTVSVRVGEAFRSLGIDGSIHRARHTYATLLLRRGANLRVVQKLMRHASLATTEAYIAVSDSELSSAIGLLGTGR